MRHGMNLHTRMGRKKIKRHAHPHGGAKKRRSSRRKKS